MAVYYLLCKAPRRLPQYRGEKEKRKKDLKGRKRDDKRMIPGEGYERQDEVKKDTGGKPVEMYFYTLL